MFNSTTACINHFSQTHPLLNKELFLFFLFSIIVVLIWSQRHYFRVISIASKKAKERLQSVEPMDLDLYLQQTAVPVAYYESAKKLLTALGKELFHTPPEKLTFQSSFKSMLYIPVSELHLNPKQLKACKSKKRDIYFATFEADDLLTFFDFFYTKKQWAQVRKNNEKLFQHGEKLLDLFFEMNPEEFLCCFALFDSSAPAQPQATMLPVNSKQGKLNS